MLSKNEKKDEKRMHRNNKESGSVIKREREREKIEKERQCEE